MTEALRTAETLPPEAIALIREGTPKPRVASSVMTPEKKQEDNAPEPAPDAAAVPSVQTETKSETSAPAATSAPESNEPRKLRVVREREAEPAAFSNALVSMTFRVPAELPSALVRASADRKAKRIRPFTQQEIVAEALGQWLKRNGY